jgi:hypothetical protein
VASCFMLLLGRSSGRCSVPGKGLLDWVASGVRCYGGFFHRVQWVSSLGGVCTPCHRALHQAK